MKNYMIVALLLLPFLSFGQDDLLDLIEEDDEPVYVQAAFKGTKIINGQSTKTKNKGELDFLIFHRFGPVNSGIDQFFGLDQANIRLGLEYGISDNFDVGIGRSSFEKTYDGYIKWRFLRQKVGAGRTPLSMVFFTSMAIGTGNPNVDASDRIGYTFELLMSRKFGSDFSLQLNPGLVHLNEVPTTQDSNQIYFLGGGFRYKLTPSLALTGEYYYRFNPFESLETYDAVGIGFDIETGGHVFQLHFTNSRPTFEKGFITQTVDDFWDGDIRFGFNISRTWQVANKY